MYVCKKKVQTRTLTWTSAIMEALDKFQVWNQDSECFEALMVLFLFLFIVTNICDKYRVWMFWSINGSLHIPVCEAFQFSHSSFPICSLFWSCKMNLEDSKYIDSFALLKDFLKILELNSKIKNIAFERVILSHNFQKIKVKPEVSNFM